jgi:tRNA(fMet)-specific endonuclease VapC
METRYLLDTDTVIFWLKERYPQINRKIETLEPDCLFISTVTVAELYFGAYNSSRIGENVGLIDELVSEIQVASLGLEAGKLFGRKKADLKRKGEILPDSDLFIAAIAIANGLVLVSNNERHFSRIGELRLENWTRPET